MVLTAEQTTRSNFTLSCNCFDVFQGGLVRRWAGNLGDLSINTREANSYNSITGLF